ncbi:OmpA family protein [Sphingobacterium spiritivorum]|uniref:OmpA family protein n=1 Tax=Sphingobacterium spiritivorum TaxID=258 RepID=UPI003DA61E23
MKRNIMIKSTYLNKLLIALLICAAGISETKAQEQVSKRTTAEKLYYQYEYYSASRIYEKLVDTKRPKAEDMERLATCYFNMNEYSLARNWYARVAEEGKISDQSQLNYADVLKKLGDYAAAKNQYKAYGTKTGKESEVELAIQGCDSAIVWMQKPTVHKIKNEQQINTRFSDFGTTPIGQQVLYVGEPMGSDQISGRTGRAFLRVYSATRDKDGIALIYPNMLPDIFNSAPYHVGPVAVNKDENVLYVTRTYPGKDTEQHKSGPYSFKKHNLEIKIYTKNGDSWNETDFPYNDTKKYAVGHAALSKDEQTLYFASNMPGGYGGVDIWYSILQPDGTWGQPVNAGAEINSAGDEMFPSVFEDRLYYSSNGFPGMGGLDIFSAAGSRSSFTNRQNLRFPVNSASDDFSYVLLGDSPEARYGYLSSDRLGGVGLDDIYSFSAIKPKITILLKGIAQHRTTAEPLEDVQLSLLSDGGKVVSRKLSAATGVFEFQLEPGTAYQLMGEKLKFHGDSVNIAALSPQKDTTIQVTLRLQPIIEKGTTFILENIYYDLDKYNIRSDAKPILNQLVNTLRDNPTLKIELSSHTDSRATHKYNMKLSQNRAQAAVDYIVSRGIARDRIVAKGYGETRLVNKCADGVKCSDEEHQANRRTEIKVLEY